MLALAIYSMQNEIFRSRELSVLFFSSCLRSAFKERNPGDIVSPSSIGVDTIGLLCIDHQEKKRYAYYSKFGMANIEKITKEYLEFCRFAAEEGAPSNKQIRNRSALL